MKSKISKILGVAVSITILVSMLIATALPTSAAVGTLSYGVVTTPSKVGQVLVPGVQIDFFAASADGNTIFAYDDANNKLYKSTNGGVSFGSSVTAGAGDAVGIAISPNFATDNTIVLAETLNVFYSTAGGATGSWVDVSPAALGIALGTGTITSVDVGPYFADNVLSILVGATIGATNTVLKFKMGFFAWEAVGAITDTVYAVAFSENHMSDAEIVAVIYDATPGAGELNVRLSRKVGTLAWNYTTYPDKNIVNGVITSAVIAMPAGSSPTSGTVVGLAGAVNGVYYVATSVSTQRLTGGGDVYSIAIGAAITEVYVGLANGTITKSVNINASSTSFTAATKPPTGATNAFVVARGSKVYATKMGPEGAFAVSTDGGVSFNEISLINAAAGALSLYDINIVDNSTMFLVMKNAGGNMYLFKTTDAAATWMRIQMITAANMLLTVSPAYATDNTLAFSDGTAVLYKSTNGGASFTAMGIPSGGISAIAIGAGGNVYAGDSIAAGFYKAGRWTNATGISTGQIVVSIAFSPKDTTGATIAIGTASGTVYESTNDGVSFTAKKDALSLNPGGAAESMYVAYAADGTLYCVGNGATGVRKLTSGVWDDAKAAVVAGSGLAVAKNGTLYASSAAAEAGIWRSLDPAATAPEYDMLSETNFPSIMGPTQSEATAASLSKLQVVNSTADNTLYALESTYVDPATGGFGYNGRLYGFKDTFIGSVTLSAPAAAKGATAAKITTIDEAAISWTAYTGATKYEWEVSTASSFATTVDDGTTTKTSATAENLLPGTTYYWRVRAISSYTGGTVANIYSKWAATWSFITALNPPDVLTVQYPNQGGVDVPIDITFTWPASTDPGTVSYEFVIAEELGNADKFAIIDDSATATTNAYKLREPLKYNTQYWWRVRSVSATTTSAWTTSFFTTAKEPVVPTTSEVVTPTVIVTQPPPIVTVTVPTQEPVKVIPDYLLWAVIAVGAVLVIAVIVLIVRTRRIS